MSYSWLVAPAPSEELAGELGLERDFDSQGEAEAWLTASYQDLSDAGVHEVSLFEADRLVYGPMSLDA